LAYYEILYHDNYHVSLDEEKGGREDDDSVHVQLCTIPTQIKNFQQYYSEANKNISHTLTAKSSGIVAYHNYLAIFLLHK